MGSILLNRPKALNALTLDMIRALDKQLDVSGPFPYTCVCVYVCRLSKPITPLAVPRSTQCRSGFPSLVKQWKTDSAVSLVTLRGAGGKAFCAGGDVVAMAKERGTDGTLRRDFFREEYIVDYKLATYPKPVVALIDGITMGGMVSACVQVGG